MRGGGGQFRLIEAETGDGARYSGALAFESRDGGLQLVTAGAEFGQLGGLRGDGLIALRELGAEK